VKVRHDEGVATRIGPEPCAVCREAGGEASAGEHTGRPLSRESFLPPCLRQPAVLFSSFEGENLH
jgi:hypothetical protein